MIITAALAWFDEAPEDLDKFVRRLPIAVDRLVAVDGGYERYPDAAPRSNRDEEQALRDACQDVGLPLEIHIPDVIWRGQIEKRNFLAQQAIKGSDWMFSLDADHLLHGIREPFREELESLTHRIDRVDIKFYTTINPDRPLSETSSTDWHSDLAGTWKQMGLLLRALPTLRYERFHWWISAAKKRNQLFWMYGGDDSRPHVEAHVLEAPFFIEHRCHFRRDQNIIGNRVFCDDRVAIVDETGQEDAPEAKEEIADAA